MMQSGVMREAEVSLEFDNEEDERTQLMVHNMKPPFLDGRVSFTRQVYPNPRRAKARPGPGQGLGLDRT